MYARTTNRRGFTLIELLMVIVIIAILAGLTTIVVLNVGGVGADAQAASDIRQLALAVESFKQKYGMYPPSKFDMPPTGASLSYATRIWPRVPDFSVLPWPGTGTLDGDQCLVFFLQGPATSKNGFSANPANPLAAGGTRVGPFFEFPDARLIKRPGASDFYSFADSYAIPNNNTKTKPYLYFVAYQDGYHPADAITVGGVTVSPYCTGAPVRYYNRNSFQIISAGANYKFGSGGTWAPGGPGWPTTADGFDDFSNFHPGKLGQP